MICLYDGDNSWKRLLIPDTLILTYEERMASACKLSHRDESASH